MTAAKHPAMPCLPKAISRRAYRRARHPSAFTRSEPHCTWLTIPIAKRSEAARSARRFLALAILRGQIGILAFHVSEERADILMNATSDDAILLTHDLLTCCQTDCGTSPHAKDHILITTRLERSTAFLRFRLKFATTPYWGWWPNSTVEDRSIASLAQPT
jgi:hypothetical protein